MPEALFRCACDRGTPLVRAAQGKETLPDLVSQQSWDCSPNCCFSSLGASPSSPALASVLTSFWAPLPSWFTALREDLQLQLRWALGFVSRSINRTQRPLSALVNSPTALVFISLASIVVGGVKSLFGDMVYLNQKSNDKHGTRRYLEKMKSKSLADEEVSGTRDHTEGFTHISSSNMHNCL